MHKTLGIILLTALAGFAFKSDKPAYRLYTGKGKPVSYEKMMKDIESADLIFFGELHDNPIGHWMELGITKDLYAVKKDQLVIGAEMFESDNQLIIDEYLQGEISDTSFESEARLWPNYKTDYKPLMEFAKKNHIPFIADNVPRRYASLVHKRGLEALDSLSADAKKFLPPLPIMYDPEVKCYKDMMNMKGMGGHVNENFPKAQAIKDATMAWFIMQNWSEGKTFIHYNGSYHSNNFEGIVWYIKQKYPNLKIVTIANVEQKDVTRFDKENLGIASYVLAVPTDMTRTR